MPVKEEVVNFLPTFRDNLLVPIFKKPIGCPETSVIN